MRRCLPVLIGLTMTMLTPALRAAEFNADFNSVNDRVWLGSAFWANPMEDFRVAGGRVEVMRGGGNRNAALLTVEMTQPTAAFELRVKVGQVAPGEGSAGFRIGITDEIKDYRAAALRGRGLEVGVTSSGIAFIGNPPDIKVKRKPLPEAIQLVVTGAPEGDKVKLTVTATDAANGEAIDAATKTVPAQQLEGLVAISANGHANERGGKANGALGANARYWFDDVSVVGDSVTLHPDRAWGPILWAMHTVHNTGGDEGHVMKITAQMPPISDKDPQLVSLAFKGDDQFAPIAPVKIDPLSRTATFRLAHWDTTKDTDYTLEYGGNEYKGVIRAEPHGRPLVVAGFTGNTDYGFPNVEITTNVGIHNPDVLFFSGDQIYEGVGGYGIVRGPLDMAVVNYLRKWYLFGWAFGDLMRDRPAICLADDHDVFQGNIWGEGGKAMRKGGNTSDDGGYIEPADFVNMVQRTQSSHHPDAYDPTPIEQGIGVYYGPMTYGGVSFAICEDRKFKSGPDKVAKWMGRNDHVTPKNMPNWDPKIVDRPGLALMGDRQLKFLSDWGTDWHDAYFKCVLTQTIFVNLATHHGGGQEYLIADLDSDGWPQTGRNKAVDALRRAFAFHYAGDQHLPSITRYGADEWDDGGYAFCVPSIAVGYPRSWRPDDVDMPVKNREMAGGRPNTGQYLDGFGNHVTVYAIGNPAAKNRPGRIPTLHDKSSGYGIVRFDPATRDITIECYRLMIDAAHPKPDDQFPGWPRTINLTDNYGRTPAAHLPTLKVNGRTDPVVQVINEKTGDIEYTLRIKGTTFRPPVFDADAKYTVKVDEQEIRGVTPGTGTLDVSFK
ncbi:MAG: twin-arginine translocation pathway signal [Phycisphaera sp.]|nr:twin-arginine translocation pathway signal [Phycisphaera sp.]